MRILDQAEERNELNPQPTGNKVMVIGIDGATFRIIDPLVQDGHLPTLGRLIGEGTRATLQSTLHPLSPTAWASFMTGMSPGNHGIFDFMARDPATYEFHPVNGSSLGAPTLWSRLSQAGKTVGVMNVPMTYPPEEVNGFLVSGMDSPRVDRAYSFPPSLSREIDQVCGGYLLDCSTRGPGGLSSEQMTSLYTERLLRLIAKRGSVARYLWEKYTPDLFMVVFVASDRIQHAAGEAIRGIEEREVSELGGCILEVYRRIDWEIQQFMDRLDESWTVMIVSDHGAAPYERVFNLAYWLVENRYLDVSKHRARGTVVYGMQRLKHRIQYTLGLETRHGKRRISPLLSIIDWRRTKAYAFGAFGSVFINLQGREPLGAVKPGKEYEDLRAEISERLLGARDPNTGTRLVEDVYRAEDVYRGECLSHAPDLLVIPATDYHVRNSLDDFQWNLTYPAGKYGRRGTPHTGKHSPEGVLIAWGPLVKKRSTVEDAQIVDIAPTILYLLGEPIPQALDGRVLEGAIHADYLACNPVIFDDREEDRSRGPRVNVYSENEEREIEDRLRGLGYLG